MCMWQLGLSQLRSEDIRDQVDIPSRLKGNAGCVPGAIACGNSSRTGPDKTSEVAIFSITFSPTTLEDPNTQKTAQQDDQHIGHS